MAATTGGAGGARPSALGGAALPALARRATVALWHELPRAVLAGGAVLLAAAPGAVAVAVSAPAAIVAAALVPPALALTALAHVAAAVVRGEKSVPRGVDPVLGLLLAGGAALAGLGLAAGGAAAVAGALAAAGSLLVFPYALAYGALRGRRGPGALRGGLILVAYRPVWALTLLGLGVLGAFAAVATAGVLAPVLPPWLLTVAATQVAALLEEIDARPARATKAPRR
jgi:hypothetical protein